MAGVPEHLREGLDFAATELLGLLSPRVEENARMVQKGLMLFRQGLVSQVRFEEMGIQAVVQDVTPANVTLDLNFINLSECSCPAEGFCRHQFAVFFQLLSQVKSVTEWMEAWRQPLKESKTIQQLGLMRAKDLLPTASSRQTPDYDQWVNTFHTSFHLIMKGNGEPKPYYISDLFQIYTKRWKANAPFEQEWKLLYHLVGYVFSFKYLMLLSMEAEHTDEQINRYYQHIFLDLMEDIEDVTNKLSVQSLPFAFDAFIEKLKEDSTDILKHPFLLQYEQIHLYRLLWTKFFKKKTWCAQEVTELRENKDISFPIFIAVIHQHFLLGEDKQALDLLSIPDKYLTPYFHFWIEQMTIHKEWKRLGPYVEEMVRKVREYLQIPDSYYRNVNFTAFFLKTIRPYCTETGKQDLYEKALIETLPYSYSEYEYMLFEREAYDRWVDLQLVSNHTITRQNPRYKVLEKQAPALLLPLYHRYVQTHIAQKGRDHYREAVRMLKKLRTLYKKLKRQDDWDFYMESLLEKTKRLRAFHEECKRGKLIDA